MIFFVSSSQFLGPTDAKLLPEFPATKWFGSLSDETISDRNEKFNYVCSEGIFACFVYS
jgi:hypothetical protein